MEGEADSERELSSVQKFGNSENQNFMTVMAQSCDYPVLSGTNHANWISQRQLRKYTS